MNGNLTLEMDLQKTLSRDKALVFILIVALLVGLGSGAGLETLAGEIVKAIITGESVSSRWVGFSGSVGEYREDKVSSFRSISAGEARSGQVNEVTFPGQNDERHYYAAIPFNGSDFQRSRLRNITLSDLQAGGLFDENDFPIFYPDGLSYSVVSDSPVETFKKEGTVTLLNKTWSTAKADLQSNVGSHVVGYKYEGDVKPIFVTSVDNYPSCYDGSSCNFQFLVPNIAGQDYHFYMIPETMPVEITTYIDGSRSTTFPYAGRPYRLNITTRAIFGDDELVERPIRIVEKQGNNMFTPAVESTGYESSAKIKTKTTGGTKEILFAPTGYSSPGSYNLSIKVLAASGKVAGVEYMTIENGNIQFTTQGPTEKNMGEYSTSYKKGVNRLTPITNCLFKKVNSGISFRLTPDTGTGSYTLVRGVPYIVDIRGSSAEFYELSEPGSHLVMSPARSEDFGETVHLSSGELPYSESNQVVFTPTLPKSEDDDFSLDLLNGQGNLLHEVNISIKGSTCGTNSEGSFSSLPSSDDFKKRINSITPVLNSLFVAGT
jgi:hypothetical protein